MTSPLVGEDVLEFLITQLIEVRYIIIKTIEPKL